MSTPEFTENAANTNRLERPEYEERTLVGHGKNPKDATDEGRQYNVDTKSSSSNEEEISEKQDDDFRADVGQSASGDFELEGTQRHDDEFIPGLLLRPPAYFGRGVHFWELSRWCTRDYYEPGYVQVDQDNLTIFNRLQKKIGFFPEDPLYRALYRPTLGGIAWDIALAVRPNVFDDNLILLTFHSKEEADDFSKILETRRSEIPTILSTKIYVCGKSEDQNARPLQKTHPLHDLVTRILSGLCQDKYAFVLDPIAEETIPSRGIESSARVAHWFNFNLPPIVFICESDAVGECEIIDDEEADLPLHRLDEFQLPLPPNARAEVDTSSTSNIRGKPVTSDVIPPVLARLHKQVRAWVDSLATDDPLYHKSLNAKYAIKAALVVTLVHEFALSFAKKCSVYKAPRERSYISGADAEKFNICSVGQTDLGVLPDLGYLVEVVWMGARAELVVDCDGWYQPALYNPTWNSNKEITLNPSSFSKSVDQSLSRNETFSEDSSGMQYEVDSSLSTSAKPVDEEQPNALDVVLADDEVLCQFEQFLLPKTAQLGPLPRSAWSRVQLVLEESQVPSFVIPPRKPRKKKHLKERK